MRNNRSCFTSSTTRIAAVVAMALGGAVGGCSPTVRVQAPDKPIVINLNVKIEQEVRVRVEKEVDSLEQKKPGVF